MIDEVMGFFLLLMALTMALLLVWGAAGEHYETDMERIAAQCLSAYYNGTPITGFSCEVYGKNIEPIPSSSSPA